MKRAWTTKRNFKNSGYNLSLIDDEKTYNEAMSGGKIMGTKIINHGFDIDMGWFIIWEPKY